MTASSKPEISKQAPLARNAGGCRGQAVGKTLADTLSTTDRETEAASTKREVSPAAGKASSWQVGCVALTQSLDIGTADCNASGRELYRAWMLLDQRLGNVKTPPAPVAPSGAAVPQGHAKKSSQAPDNNFLPAPAKPRGPLKSPLSDAGESKESFPLKGHSRVCQSCRGLSHSCPERPESTNAPPCERRQPRWLVFSGTPATPGQGPAPGAPAPPSPWAHRLRRGGAVPQPMGKRCGEGGGGCDAPRRPISGERGGGR